MFWEEGGKISLSVNGPLDHKTEQAPNIAISIYVSTSDERRENPYKKYKYLAAIVNTRNSWVALVKAKQPASCCNVNCGNFRQRHTSTAGIKTFASHPSNYRINRPIRFLTLSVYNVCSSSRPQRGLYQVNPSSSRKWEALLSAWHRRNSGVSGRE